MLVIETIANGTRTVRVRKDWNPSRISRAYVPPTRFHHIDADACKVQTLLLRHGAEIAADLGLGRAQLWTR